MIKIRFRVFKVKIRQVLFLLFAVLVQSLACAQSDSLLFVSGKKLAVKIVLLNSSNVTYSLGDSAKARKFTVSKNDIRFLVHPDGTFEVFSVKKTGDYNNSPMFQKGLADAQKYYKHSGGAPEIGVLTFFTGGLVGLIAASIVASSIPTIKNLGIPANAPVANRDYMVGYCKQAKGIKQRKVLNACWLGTLGALVVISVLRQN